MYKKVRKFLAMFLAMTMMTVTFMAPQPASAADQTVEEKINQTLSELSLENRVSLMSGGSANVGCGATKAVTGLGRMNMSDGPLGITSNGTAFSSGLIMAATWNPEHAYEVGRIIGAEAKANGVQIMLGPGVDIIRDLANGRNFEYFSEDPLLGSRISTGYVSGMQTQEVSATLKHMFANSTETNRNWASSNLSERAMQEIYLAPYRMAITKGDAWSLMTAANRANGVFTSDNRYIMTNMMKYDFGLQGVIMTDWCSVRSDVISAKAGLDVAMPSAGPYGNLLNQVRTGLVPEWVVNSAAQRVARLAYLTKSTTNMVGYTSSDRKPGESRSTASHANESVELAKEGEVLLKNEGLLPLTKTNPRIALIGKYVNYEFEGSGLGGSSGTYPSSQVHNEAAIRNIYSVLGQTATFEVPTYSESSESNITASITRAVTAAQAADYVVIYAGINKSPPENYGKEGDYPDTEGNDRKNINFPSPQLRLIQAIVDAGCGSKTVVVLNGSVFEVADWINGVNAVLTTFYPGQNGATATADILTGVVNPSGKLPFTWPKRYVDTQGYVPYPAGNQEQAKSQDVNFYEGVFEGYRYYDQRNLDPNPVNHVYPEFAFGHGLSYSTYDWSNISLSSILMGPEDTITASVTLTNTNNRVGKQVVQLYIQDPVSSVARPVKELKGFDKKQINANGNATFTFSITKDELSFWNVNTHSMKAEAGQFNILVGDASDSIKTIASFTLTADSAPNPDYTVVQAENFTSQSGTSLGNIEEVDQAIMNYAPNQYLTLGGIGSSAEWKVSVPTAGKYSIIFRYSNAAYNGAPEIYTEQYNKPAELLINGEICGSYDFQNTRHAFVWNYDSIDAVLMAGDNTVKLRGTQSSSGVYLDKIIVQTINQWWLDAVPAVDGGGGVLPSEGDEFEAESATMLNNAAVRRDIIGASGGAYIQLNNAGSSVSIPIFAPTSVRYRLKLTYSNGSDSPSPCDVYVNGVKKFTYTLGPTGGSEKWKYEETDMFALETGTNIVLISSKSGAVNLDKINVVGGMAYLDHEAPVINGTTPANGGAILKDVCAYYSESINLGDGTVIITDGANTIPSSFATDGVALRITPDFARLQSGVTYTVTIGPNAAVDASGNPLGAAYSFTFIMPASNYFDPEFKYSGTWADTGTAKIAATGASVDFWFYGDQCVLRGMDSAASVNVWIDDYLSPNAVNIQGGGSGVISFYDTGLLEYGIHYVKIDFVSGAFGFTGAYANTTLVSQSLPKTGWTASGSTNLSTDPVSRGIDNDRSTRWTSGATMSSGSRHWYSIDLGQPTEINALLLVCRQSNVGSGILDYTRAYEFYVSNNGSDWIGPITSGPGSPMFTEIIFPTLTIQYVRVVQTGVASSDWWSIYEAYGFRLPDSVAPEPVPPDTPVGITATGLNQQIKLTWPACAGAVRYEVSRDGAAVAVISELGYVDILNINDGLQHEYTVIAIDSLGNRSQPSASITASTGISVVDIPRSGWSVSASHNIASDPAVNAIDPNPGNRWTSGAAMNSSMWFTIDLGLVYKFNVISIKSNTTDYARGYSIVTSNNGTTWSAAIASGGSIPNTNNIILTNASTARYIRINQTGSNSSWWSIYELNVALRDNLDRPQDVTAVGYNGFIRVDWMPPAEVFIVAHHYDVYRNGVLVKANLTQTRYVDVDAVQNKVYNYEIVAINSSGVNSPRSMTASASFNASNTAIPRNYWAAGATNNNSSAGLAVDFIDDPPVGTNWSSGANQNGSQVFYLYMNDVYPINELKISSGPTYYGRRYNIMALVDGIWETVASNVTGQPDYQTIPFDKMVYTNTLYIYETATYSGNWYIFELYAYNTTIPAPPAWSIDGIAVSPAGVTVDISRSANPVEAFVMLASYSVEGKLLGVETKPITANGTYLYFFATPPTSAVLVKAFIWDGSYVPLAEARVKLL